MPTIVKPMLAAGLLLALSACSKLGGGGQDQMAWAKDALERNDRIEVVASDPPGEDLHGPCEGIRATGCPSD